MKILVTGGAGFIASHITDAYIEAGHEVLVVDNLSSGKEINLNPKAKFIRLDVTDQKLSEVIGSFKPDFINHHAAQIVVGKSVEDPKNDATINILGSLNVLEAARKVGGVKKIIFASTGGAIYGETNLIPTTEECEAWPISPYGVAKLSVEHYLHYYFIVHNLPFTVLRYANVYGPRQNPHGEAGVVAIFYQRILANQAFEINGAGEQTRDFIFVDDVVSANLKATESSITGIFNIGTSTETSVNQLVEHMKHAVGHSAVIPHAPGKPGEQQRSCLSFAKAAKAFSWNPATSLSDGLNKTAEYFRSQ